jgi:hypothetical protein
MSVISDRKSSEVDCNLLCIKTGLKSYRKLCELFGKESLARTTDSNQRLRCSCSGSAKTLDKSCFLFHLSKMKLS